LQTCRSWGKKNDSQYKKKLQGSFRERRGRSRRIFGGEASIILRNAGHGLSKQRLVKERGRGQQPKKKKRSGRGEGKGSSGQKTSSIEKTSYSEERSYEYFLGKSGSLLETGEGGTLERGGKAFELRNV